jgi:hypothetical protein
MSVKPLNAGSPAVKGFIIFGIRILPEHLKTIAPSKTTTHTSSLG